MFSSVVVLMSNEDLAPAPGVPTGLLCHPDGPCRDAGPATLNCLPLRVGVVLVTRLPASSRAFAS